MNSFLLQLEWGQNSCNKFVEPSHDDGLAIKHNLQLICVPTRSSFHENARVCSNLYAEKSSTNGKRTREMQLPCHDISNTLNINGVWE